MTSVSETLYRAADLIEERGWRTGGGWPEVAGAPSELCLEGGIMAALGITLKDAELDYQTFQACPAYRAVHEYLRLPHGWALYVWNDQRDARYQKRTAAQVIEVLRAAAVIEAARESEAAKVGVSA